MDVINKKGKIMRKLLLLLCGGINMAYAMTSSPVVTVGLPHATNAIKYVEVYGHRGARSFSPEMTLGGYRTALRVGVNWVDSDIIMSRDGVIMASHDLWLNPDVISNPDGKFWAKSNKEFMQQVNKDGYDKYIDKYLAYNLTMKQLQQFNAGKINPDSPYAKWFPDQIANSGAVMPTLQQIIDYTNANSNKKVNFQLEIKSDPEHDNWTASPDVFAKKLYAILKKNNLINRVEIQAFDWRYLYALQKLDKNIKTAYLVGSDGIESMQNLDPKIAGLWSGGKLLKDYNNSLPQMVKDLGGSLYEPEDITLTKEQLDEAHRLGLKVVVWTWPENSGKVIDSVVINRLIDWGIDGIITDNPAQLNSILAARNYPVPQNYPNAK